MTTSNNATDELSIVNKRIETLNLKLESVKINSIKERNLLLKKEKLLYQYIEIKEKSFV